MKIYLINPRFPDTFWGFRHVSDLGGIRYGVHNLALPTVAAMTSSDIDVELCDENLESIDFDTDADLIGITGYNLQAPRMFEIAEVFHNKGKPVAIGGPFASLCPEQCEPHADILFVGEAERTWPRFLEDFRGGQWEERYEETEKIDLSITPVPRWDLLPIKLAGLVPVQTTRGCPFTCEFCDVIVYLGRTVRQKTPDQVIAEVETLYPHLVREGRNSIFFADDNFIGNRNHAKAICKAMIEFNRSLKQPVTLSTQVTINMAQDKELMELMAQANFRSLFFGLESPKKENLLEANKRQNTINDMAEDIRTIQSYGIFIWAGMIVGFDGDNKECFREQADFLAEANIPLSMTGMLNAPAHTPLWERLKKEGRLIKGFQYCDQADTNIIPKQMTVGELREGYVKLMQEIYSYENYGNRLIGNMKAITSEPAHNRLPILHSIRQSYHDFSRLLRTIAYFLFTRDREKRRYLFRVLRQIAKTHPAYLKDGLWHMAMAKHFHEYSKQLAENFEHERSQEQPLLARAS